MARSAVIWVQQGKVRRRVCSMKSSGACPQALLSQHILKLHRWEKGWYPGMGYFLLGGIQSAKHRSNARPKKRYVTNICIFTCKPVCLSPNDNGCQEPAVLEAGKETRRQFGCYAASYPQDEQRGLCWLKWYFNVMKLSLTVTILWEVCLIDWLIVCSCLLLLVFRELFLLVLHLGVKELIAPAVKGGEPYWQTPTQHAVWCFSIWHDLSYKSASRG